MNGVHQTRRKPIAELYGYFETFPVKILTSATDALYAIRQTPFMIGSYSNELRADLEFVVPVTPDLDVSGIGGLKNCTNACSPIVPVPSRSGLAVSRLASLNAHTRRRYRDGRSTSTGTRTGDRLNKRSGDCCVFGQVRSILNHQVRVQC